MSADAAPVFVRVATEEDQGFSGWPHSDSPQATIVVAIHNAIEYLDRLLNQLSLTQHPSFEVIIVDDGSTDGSEKVLSDLNAFPAPLLILRLDRNGGVASARNLALKHARGAYVWMVDGDDRWRADSLAVLCKAADRSGSDIVIAQATRVVVSSGRETPIPAPSQPGLLAPHELIELYMRGEIQGQLWNKLFSRNLLARHPELFPRITSKSDVCGLVQLLADAQSATVIADDVYAYLWRSGSIATSQAKPLDLLRVAEVSYRVLGHRTGSQALRDLVWVRSISIPLLTEVWRFDDRSPAAQYAVRVITSGLGFLAAVRLLSQGETSAAILAFALKYARPIVRRRYVRSRRNEWA